MLTLIWEAFLKLSTGLGLAWIWDKFTPDGLPKTGISTWGPLKIGLFVLILVVGAILALFVGRKLKIFKTRR